MRTTTNWIALLLVLCLSPACAMYEPWPGGSRSENNQPPAEVVRAPAGLPEDSSDSPESPSSSGEQVRPETTQAIAPPVGPAGFLLEEAARHRRQGNLPAAARAVERAMRIQPGNPWLSLELGKIRLEQNNASQAELLAQRALAQAGSDRGLKAQSWRLTAAARQAVGDAKGAAAALSNVSD